jgi:hypothetical protein
MMKTDSLLGVWAGTAVNSNGWDMEITVTISQPFEIGSTLGAYTIPTIPCYGTFTLLEIRGQTLELKAENKEGPCGDADSDSLEVLSDGTLLYVSRGDGWEARGVLQRAN